MTLRAPAYDVFILESTRLLLDAFNAKVLLAYVLDVPRLYSASQGHCGYGCLHECR